MALQCQSCFGVYEPIGADGLPYFHTCPPITYAVVTRGKRTGLVPLDQLQPTDVVRVQRGKDVVEVTVDALLPDDQRIGDVQRPRPDARDENLEIVTDARRQRVTRMKAEGLGVVDVAPAATAELPVLDTP